MPTAPVSHLQNATEQLGLARDHLVVGVADAVNSGVDAAREVKAQVGERVDTLRDQAGDLIRRRPWTSVAVALAAGYLFAKSRSRS